MEGEHRPGTSVGSSAQLNERVIQRFQHKFAQVQSILDQNRLLIIEINQNHESGVPDNLSRNIGLIRELNNNIRRVTVLYAELSNSFVSASSEASVEGESTGTMSSYRRGSQKRMRPGCRRSCCFSSCCSKIGTNSETAPSAPTECLHGCRCS